MRFVVYDDESLEAITVLNLPLTDRDIEARGRIWRVAVPPKISLTIESGPPRIEKMQVVDLEFEPFVRQSSRHGRQRAWFCFTGATELAMLLNPAWLPGQRGAVDYLQDQNDALAKMLMAAIV